MTSALTVTVVPFGISEGVSNLYKHRLCWKGRVALVAVALALVLILGVSVGVSVGVGVGGTVSISWCWW